MDSFDLRHRTTLVKLRELRYRASDSSLLCDVVFSPLNFCFQSCYQFSCNVISFLGKNIICSQEKYFSRKDCLWELSRTFEKCFSPSHEIMSIYLCLSLPREHLKKKSSKFKFIANIHHPFPKTSNYQNFIDFQFSQVSFSNAYILNSFYHQLCFFQHFSVSLPEFWPRMEIFIYRLQFTWNKYDANIHHCLIMFIFFNF